LDNNKWIIDIVHFAVHVLVSDAEDTVHHFFHILRRTVFRRDMVHHSNCQAFLLRELEQYTINKQKNIESFLFPRDYFITRIAHWCVYASFSNYRI
jgi:hypothetical protein